MTRNWQLAMPTHEAYWMDRVLFDVHHKPSHLQAYKDDPDAYMKDMPLTDRAKAAIRDNEIGEMYLMGVNPYLLRAHCLGLHIPEKTFLDELRAVAARADGGAAHG